MEKSPRQGYIVSFRNVRMINYAKLPVLTATKLLDAIEFDYNNEIHHGARCPQHVDINCLFSLFRQF